MRNDLHMKHQQNQWMRVMKDPNTGMGIGKEAYEIGHRKRSVKYLYDGYIRERLKFLTGMDVPEITPELIELKREQLKLFREIKKTKEVGREIFGY